MKLQIIRNVYHSFNSTYSPISYTAQNKNERMIIKTFLRIVKFDIVSRAINKYFYVYS